jgi:hypothetical protein
MRTAIYVRASTTLDIETSEDNLEFIAFDTTVQPVTRILNRSNSFAVQPGLYKIVSMQAVKIGGDSQLLDIRVTQDSKTPFPDLSLDAWNIPTEAAQSFFDDPAKSLKYV